MRRSRGIALIELLLTIALSAGLIFAVSTSFQTATNLENRVTQSQQAFLTTRNFEEAFRTRLESAQLSANTTSTASFFMAGAVSLGGDGITSDFVTFTAPAKPRESLVDAQGEFEALNERFGPQGGLAEYSFSMTPVGNANGKTGLFLRTQIPADGDPAQGGYEQLLSENVASVSFEFFDGLNWVGAWDTSTQNPKRIPAAVRVHYKLNDDETEKLITIQLKHSDVTPTNPVATGGGG
ncbi:MAG: type II secretion system protein GspJ [Fimbriimonadales bacterium]